MGRLQLRAHGRDRTPTVAPDFIVTVARAEVEQGYLVVLKNILHTRQHADLLRVLIAGHRLDR